jgi:hypothetical protein
MSSAHLLLTIALMGPPVETAGVRAPDLAAVPWTAEELRAEFRSVMTAARRKGPFVPERDVPPLVLLHHAVRRTAALDRAEQVRMRQALEYRLEEAAEKLRYRRSREGAVDRQRRPVGSSRAKTVTLADASGVAGGAAEAANVQQLIDLIEATIQPESWETNGGRGTIRYYSPLHVLVIRNTQQVHREIGGLIGVVGAQR